MADEPLHRTGVVGKSDITVWTLLEVTTVTTHPCASRPTTVIEEEGFLPEMLVLTDHTKSLTRYEWGLYG